MQIQHHPLPSASLGTHREIASFHYGPAGGRKAYLQASLHADELPGMLVAHHLRARLKQLEDDGALLGEVVIVPLANPIGVAQSIQGSAFGRFDLPSGVNFNRGYPHLTPKLKQALEGKLGGDGDDNVRLIRELARQSLQEWPGAGETEAMKVILLSLAVDADVVLDLHCDHEAVMHLYTAPQLADRAMPLAALLGAQVVLTANESGDDPFDEACSRHWWELAEHAGTGSNVPFACLSATVELRGTQDVRHDLARQDAEALLDFLALEGFVACESMPTVPAAACEPTPLQGVEPLAAPHGGLLVFVREPGEDVRAGDVIAEIVDPVSGLVTPLCTSISGRFFARTNARFVHRGMRVAKVAGATPFRVGKLLSA
ncbi:succinylglutamate desuccinylase/aspartoacylase family protein [Noviherbaspirillum galbum]|uniref:Succinylglutamate desuccinylase/aspartoacylase family protein n=1 Tax=Noviherbaspirillum galbum TaxID=2709383 RepID=A0A6B3SFD4_9BURK|nr:succinylglutamate desuccinylase/aspartoacylase family protein [Noviherbaspirillum galbum]NEX59554.1 succinylglutamate desuccinylase/aspartoacylase family protein [Noviherbaspirillum galbum]